MDVFTSVIPSHTHPFDYERLKPFGCLAFAHDRHRQSKVAPIAKRFVLVSIEANARAWRLWDKHIKRIFVTGDADFREHTFPAVDETLSPDVSPFLTNTNTLDILLSNASSPPLTSNRQPLINNDADEFLPDSQDLSVSQSSATHPSDSVTDTHPSTTDKSPLDHLPDLPSSTISTSEHTPISTSRPAEHVLRRTSRQPSQPQRYGFEASTSTDSDHPTHAQAMASPDKAAWLKAMQEEFDSLNQHSVGTLVDPPPDANVLGGMWVFNKKRDEHNQVVRFKARWVVFGNHQIKGLDYNDTHASVGMTDSLRILFAIAVCLGMQVCQFDVVTAFLNGEMGDVVYSRQVTGFKHPTQPNRVWLLNKSLYGTRQAAGRWQQHFNATPARYHLQPAPSDSAVYVRHDHEGLLILHLHVDDSMVFSSSPAVMKSFRAFLESQYNVKWTS